jgi:hypothetical protein
LSQTPGVTEETIMIPHSPKQRIASKKYKTLSKNAIPKCPALGVFPVKIKRTNKRKKNQ